MVYKAGEEEESVLMCLTNLELPLLSHQSCPGTVQHRPKTRKAKVNTEEPPKTQDFFLTSDLNSSGTGLAVSDSSQGK